MCMNKYTNSSTKIAYEGTSEAINFYTRISPKKTGSFFSKKTVISKCQTLHSRQRSLMQIIRDSFNTFCGTEYNQEFSDCVNVLQKSYSDEKNAKRSFLRNEIMSLGGNVCGQTVALDLSVVSGKNNTVRFNKLWDKIAQRNFTSKWDELGYSKIIIHPFSTWN